MVITFALWQCFRNTEPYSCILIQTKSHGLGRSSCLVLARSTRAMRVSKGCAGLVFTSSRKKKKKTYETVTRTNTKAPGPWQNHLLQPALLVATPLFFLFQRLSCLEGNATQTMNGMVAKKLVESCVTAQNHVYVILILSSNQDNS